MKKIFLLLSVISLSLCVQSQSMYTWRAHLACGDVQQLAVTPETVFALGGDMLFSIDKETEEISLLSKMTGLHGSSVNQIAYIPAEQCVVVTYEDGMIDYITEDRIDAQTDLKIKSMSGSKHTNNLFVDGNRVYMAMPFGIIVLNVTKQEILDTYYIGDLGSEINVSDVVCSSDSIFALSGNTLYFAAKQANLSDYTNWQRYSTEATMTKLGIWQNRLYALADSLLVQREDGVWKPLPIEQRFTHLMTANGNLYVRNDANGYYQVTDQQLQYTEVPGVVSDIHKDGSAYWYALGSKGVLRWQNGETQAFQVDGPIINMPYRMNLFGDRLYVVPGGRWATEMNRPGNIMIYHIEDDYWTNLSNQSIVQQCGGDAINDIMNIAEDPNEPEHFYATSYGEGIIECRGTTVVRHYNIHNSPIQTAAPGYYELFYMRTDGALFDEAGNLWFINTEVNRNIHVVTPEQLRKASTVDSAQWAAFPMKDKTGQVIRVNTPGEMFIDPRNPNWKWIPYLRATPGLFRLDDHGTPTKGSDDVTTFRTSFTDQNGNVITPEEVHAVAQEKDGRIWMSLKTGIITIPAEVDFATSDACERIIIPRQDGTDLADYLLNTECINAIAIDGANRKWFGTQSSGLYLMSADGLETIEHFTTDNSPLLSNTIMSLAIDPKTGKVFIGTDAGIVSFQSDASEPAENLSEVYAYPNPVRPEYTGIITIKGLMDETVLHIVDGSGNLVCQTRSNGGIAVWDGKNATGQRVAGGVYSVLCNTADGQQHCVAKIMVMH